MGIEYSWLQYVIPPVVLLAVVAALIVYVWPDKKKLKKPQHVSKERAVPHLVTRPEPEPKHATAEERARVLRRIQG